MRNVNDIESEPWNTLLRASDSATIGVGGGGGGILITKRCVLLFFLLWCFIFSIIVTVVWFFDLTNGLASPFSYRTSSANFGVKEQLFFHLIVF